MHTIQFNGRGRYGRGGQCSFTNQPCELASIGWPAIRDLNPPPWKAVLSEAILLVRASAGEALTAATGMMVASALQAASRVFEPSQ